MPCRGGDAQVVTMLALYSNVRSSNPAELYKISVKMLLKEQK